MLNCRKVNDQMCHHFSFDQVRLSTCRGNGFWPGTGDVHEVGEGPGLGCNVNIPFPEKGLGDAEYLAAFEMVSILGSQLNCIIMR